MSLDADVATRLQVLQHRLEAGAIDDAAHQKDVSQALALHEAESWEDCLTLLGKRPHRLNCGELAIQASANFELGKFADAEVLADLLLEMDKTDKGALKTRRECRQQRGDLYGALKDLKQLQSLGCMVSLAVHCCEAGIEAARREAKQAASQAPASTTASRKPGSVQLTAAVLKAEQQQSKVLARIARQSQAEYAERRRQEQSAKEALQQELASLKAVAGGVAATAAKSNNASGLTDSAADAEQLDNPELSKSTISATATTSAVTVKRKPQGNAGSSATTSAAIVKRKPQGNAGSSVDSPRIAAVMSSAPASHGAAARVEEQMVNKSANAAAAASEAAGAAASSIETAGAAAALTTESAILQQAASDTSAQHTAQSQQVHSSVASLAGDGSSEDLVQDIAVVASDVEGSRVSVTSQLKAASPAESGERMDQEAVPTQQVGDCAERDMLDRRHVGQQEVATTSPSVEHCQLDELQGVASVGKSGGPPQDLIAAARSTALDHSQIKPAGVEDGKPAARRDQPQPETLVEQAVGMQDCINASSALSQQQDGAVGRAGGPPHDHMPAASGVADHQPCAKPTRAEEESSVMLNQPQEGVLPEAPVGMQDADNSSPTVGHEQGNMAGEAGVTETGQQHSAPMLPHEQAAAEAVRAAAVAQEAAHKALLKAQQAQQAQQNYIAAEVARQVQARAAKMQQDLDAARQAAESARAVEAVSRAQQAQYAQQAQQAMQAEAACQIEHLRRAAKDAKLGRQAEAESARHAKARAIELQSELESAQQAIAAAQAAEAENARQAQASIATLQQELQLAQQAAASAKAAEAAGKAELAKDAEQAMAAQAASLQQAFDAKLAQQAALLTQAAELAKQNLLAQQAQRVQEATQAEAARQAAAESAKLAQEATAAHEAAELAAITQAAREILAEEEAEERQLRPALKRESAQAAWHDTLSDLHALVAEDPHTRRATMYQPQNYPEPDHGTRYLVKSQHGVLVVEEPPLELYEGCRRQEDVPALKHALDRVQSCKWNGFLHGAQKHLTRALDLAHTEAICPEEIHDLFVARAEVYAELQQPRMAFIDHLEAAKCWPEGEAAAAVLSQLGVFGLKDHMQRFYDNHRTWLCASRGLQKNVHVEEKMLRWRGLTNTVLSAFLKKPVGNDAEVLLAKVYAETKDAMASVVHWFVRVSLELQLGFMKHAQRSVALFGQHLVDFLPPCWLLHFRTLLLWSTGALDPMHNQLQLLMSRELTWWDREVAYQKPAAEDLERLAAQTAVLLNSWLLPTHSHQQASVALRHAEEQCASLMCPAIRARHTCLQAHAAAEHAMQHGAGTFEETASMFVDCLTQYECARAMDPSNSSLVVHCHIRLLKHLGSTGAIAELVKCVLEEDTVTPVAFRDLEALHEFGAILQADRREVEARASGAITLCRCVNLIGLPITAPSKDRTKRANRLALKCHSDKIPQRQFGKFVTRLPGFQDLPILGHQVAGRVAKCSVTFKLIWNAAGLNM